MSPGPTERSAAATTPLARLTHHMNPSPTRASAARLLVAAAAALAARSVAAEAVVSLAIDWPAFLSRADPTWNWTAANKTGRPDEWVRSLFGGNAMLGFMLWHDDASDAVRVAVSRADVYDDRGVNATPNAFMNNFVYDRPRLPIGSFFVSFAAPVTAATGRIVLHGARAEYNLSTAAGSVALRVWACADAAGAADVIVLEAESAGGESASVTWVPAIAQSTWSGRDPKYVPNPPTLNASAPSPGGAGTMNITTQPHLRGTAHSTAVLQLPPAGARTVAVFIAATSAVLASPADADAWASGQVLAAQAAGVDALRFAHEAWWRAWWPQGGSLFLDYSVLEQLYYVQIYKFGSAARRGRAFMDLMGPWFIDEVSLR